MIVKICGITNREDAAAAIAGGRHRRGLQFLSAQPALYRTGASRRDRRRRPGVRRVGVFVNEAPERVEEIARAGARSTWPNCTATKPPADYPRRPAGLEGGARGPDFDIALYRRDSRPKRCCWMAPPADSTAARAERSTGRWPRGGAAA